MPIVTLAARDEGCCHGKTRPQPPVQLDRLNCWLEGWSYCLDEINYMRTGYRSGGLLDVHIVTDQDIEKRTSYAAKIGAVTDPARPLEMKSGDAT